MLTRQEVFNKVYQHFILEQNPHSVGSNGECRYRTPEGRKCAIGIFIPDDLYYEGLEGRTAITVLDEIGESIGLDPMDTNFLVDLQRCHDKSSLAKDGVFDQKREVFGFMLDLFAGKYNLTVPY